MAEIVIAPATADRFDDAQHALTGGGDGAGCQCQWWMMPNADFQRMPTDQRRQLLRDEMSDTTPPALIAYVDGTAAGWVRVGPRASQARLVRTKAIAPGMQGDADDASIWAITCFVVRREFRSQGLQSKLVKAAVAFAREQGASTIEGYPIDTAEGRHPVNDLYHGTLSAFEASGFREVARPQPDRVVVSLGVEPQG